MMCHLMFIQNSLFSDKNFSWELWDILYILLYLLYSNLRISRIINFEMFAKINSKNDLFTKKCNNYPVKLLFLIIRNTYKQYFIWDSQSPKITKILEKKYFSPC